MRIIHCYRCERPEEIPPSISSYINDLFRHNPKLKFLCTWCGEKIASQFPKPRLEIGRHSYLVAIQGADYIPDFGEFQ